MNRKANRISSLKTVRTFMSGRACSDTLFSVLDNAFDSSSEPGTRSPEERAAVSFAGGILQHGYQCGMIWGATLAAGAEACRIHGSGEHAENAAILAAQRLVESFRAGYKKINCSDFTGIDKSSSTMQMIMHFLVKGGTIKCFRMAAGYAPVAFEEIQSTISRAPVEGPSSPVSCSAMLARKMGASELHTVMAAGLAGGIGLSGGACGALGAAIWIMGMNTLEEGVEGNLWDSKAFKSRADGAISRFIKCTGCEFECAEILGRRFENVEDHAAYVRDGGCSKIIEALAAE